MCRQYRYILTYVHTGDIIITIKITNIFTTSQKFPHYVLQSLPPEGRGSHIDLPSVPIVQFASSSISYKWNHVYICLFSFNIIKILPFVMCILASFFFIAQEYSIVWICHNLFDHSPVGICVVSSFCLLHNRTAMNICVPSFFFFFQLCHEAHGILVP